MPDCDVAVDFPVVAATVDSGVDGRRAYPSADMRVGVQVAGDILYGSGQKGFECTEIGKGNGNPPANRCGSHITAEGVADTQIGINPSETRAAVKQGFDAVVLETGF